MRRSRGVLVLGVALVAALAWLVTRSGAPRGSATTAAAPVIDFRPGEPVLLSERPAAVEANAPAVALAREVVTEPQVAGSTAHGAIARVVGTVIAPPELGLDEEHPLDRTKILWSVFPNAEDEAAGKDEIVRQLEFVDERGRFLLEDVPVGRALEIEVLPPAGPETVVALAALAAGELRSLVVELDPGAEVRGYVQNEAGEPVPGALVLLEDRRRVDLRSLELDELERGFRVATDPEGRFEFTGLPRSTWALSLVDVPAASPPVPVDTSEGDVADLRMTVAPAQTFEIVTRTADGRPVDCTLHYSPVIGTLETLAPGHFRLLGPPRIFRSVTAFGHVDGQFLGAQAHDVHTRVSPLELVLSPERSVEIDGMTYIQYQPRDWLTERNRIPLGTSALVGRIEDGLGDPLDDILVSVRLEGGERTSRTNPRGEFLLQELAAGTAELVLESPTNGALLRSRVELEPDRRSCLELRFEAPDPACVEIRFLSDGRPCGGHLRLEGERGRLRRWIDGSGGARLELPYPGRYTGRFLPAGELEPRRVEIDAPAHVELEFRLEDLPLAEAPR